MSTNTVIMQGSFTSTGENILIPLRAGITWMNVYNITNMSADQTVASDTQFYWQLGFPDQFGITYYKSNATNAANLVKYSNFAGFSLIDTSSAVPGVLNSTITAISTAATPIVTNSGVNGLVAGQIVRLINCAGGAASLNGIDWVVGSSSLTNTTFQLFSAPQLATAGTTGAWRVIEFDPIYYPRNRVIVGSAPAVASDQTVVVTSVPHGMTVGQQFRFNITSSLYGSAVVYNNVQATVLSVDSDVEFVCDLDSSVSGDINFPVATTMAFTPAQMIPFGENTAVANAMSVNSLQDATVNTAQIGMMLKGSASAGLADDVIYWTAGTSFSVDNQ